MGITYFLLDEELNRVKVGHTEKQTLQKRTNQIRYGCMSHCLRLMAQLPNTSWDTEEYYKQLFFPQLIPKQGVGNEEMFYYKGIVKTTLRRLSKGKPMKRATISSSTAQDYAKYVKSKKCNLDPDFQRDDVWLEKARIQMVNSMLCGYPIGLFSYAKIGETAECIDGKQRSRTLSLLLSNNLVYNSRKLDKDITEFFFEELDGLLFNQWPQKYQDIINNTPIAIWTKPATKQEASSMFRVMNKSMNRVNAEEIRHADDPHSGMNRLKRKVAAHPYWSKIKTPSAINRKAVEELVGSYFLLLVKGVTNKMEQVDKFIRDNKDAESQALNVACDDLLKYIDILNECLPSTKSARSNLSSKSAQYALIGAFHQLYSSGKQVQSKDKLKECLAHIQKLMNAKNCNIAEIEAYKKAASKDAPSSRDNRNTAISAFKSLMSDCFCIM